jgi:hypothetical protein
MIEARALSGLSGLGFASLGTPSGCGAVLRTTRAALARGCVISCSVRWASLLGDLAIKCNLTMMGSSCSASSVSLA